MTIPLGLVEFWSGSSMNYMPSAAIITGLDRTGSMAVKMRIDLVADYKGYKIEFRALGGDDAGLDVGRNQAE